MSNPHHFAESVATSEDIDMLFCLLGDCFPQKLDRLPTAEEAAILKPRACSLGRKYRKECRCPVNGDGYWYWRQELLCDGQHVGSVAVPGGGGEL